MSELKPCPFCGGSAESDEAVSDDGGAEAEGGVPFGYGAYAGCPVCDIFFNRDNEEVAIAAWNQRTPGGNE